MTRQGWAILGVLAIIAAAVAAWLFLAPGEPGEQEPASSQPIAESQDAGEPEEAPAEGTADAGQESAGQESAGQEAASQEAASQEAASQEAASQEAAGQEQAGTGSPAEGAPEGESVAEAEAPAEGSAGTEEAAAGTAPAEGAAGESDEAAEEADSASATAGTGATGAGTSPAASLDAQGQAGQEPAQQPGGESEAAAGDEPASRETAQAGSEPAGAEAADARQAGGGESAGGSEAGGQQESRQTAALPEDGALEDSGAAPEIALPPAIPPSFDVVRVEPNGDAVIAGRAEPRSEVTLTDNGTPIASATANSAGEWVMILEEPLRPGSHELSLTATTPRGEEIVSEEVVVVSVPQRKPSAPQVAEQPQAPQPEAPQQEDGQAAGEAATGEAADQAPASEGEGALVVVSPREGEGPSRVLQEPQVEEGLSDQSLVLSAVDYGAGGQIVISGRAEPGARIRVYLDNALIGETTADADGNWSLSPEAPVTVGLHRLRVDQVEEGGQVLARIETPFSRAEALTELPGDRFVVVQPGNSLWRIARRTYGEGLRYTVIYQSNKEQIRDPDLIYPGQIFELPRPGEAGGGAGSG